MMVNAVLAAATDPQQASSQETTSHPTGETKAMPAHAEESERSSVVAKSEEEQSTTAATSINVNVKTESVGDMGRYAKDTQSTEKGATASATTKENQSEK